MNHDCTHCSDATPDCPQDCFYKQLDDDLQSRTDLYWLPISFAKIDCDYKGDDMRYKLRTEDSRNLTQLKTMLDYERNTKKPHYGATLTHWKVDGIIDIDADALQVLVEHYERKEKSDG